MTVESRERTLARLEKGPTSAMRVLVALDGSRASDRILPVVSGLVRPGASTRLLTVSEDPPERVELMLQERASRFARRGEIEIRVRQGPLR